MNWKFELNEVVEYTEDNSWWHIVKRLDNIDNKEEKYYCVMDGTHTTRNFYIDDDMDDLFTSKNWKTKKKPLSVRGFLVNGRLCNPDDIEKYKGKSIIHDYVCDRCNENSNDGIDIIHNNKDNITTLECRNCLNCWTDSNQ